MTYGLYISAAGARAQSQRLEVLTHNLANVDTPGFKRELAVLEARHAEAIERGEDSAESNSMNNIGGGIAMSETMTEFAGGNVKRTDQITDMAIRGNGFFLVEKEGEQFLTKAGNFRLSPDGRLTTQQGYSVLSEDGAPVAFDPTLGWRVTPSGTIEQDGLQLPLAIVEPTSMGDLSRVGENLFRPLAQVNPVAIEQRQVASHHLEISNVKPTLEMMQLIETSRAFEANIKMIQNQDSLSGALINRVLRQS